MTPFEWAIGADTGISSLAIMAVMEGLPSGSIRGHSPRPPADSSDFGRCYRLLIHFPQYRDRLGEVAALHREWAPYVRDWAELTRLYDDALAQVRSERTFPMIELQAPNLYAALERCRAGVVRTQEGDTP